MSGRRLLKRPRLPVVDAKVSLLRACSTSRCVCVRACVCAELAGSAVAAQTGMVFRANRDSPTAPIKTQTERTKQKTSTDSHTC